MYFSNFHLDKISEAEEPKKKGTDFRTYRLEKTYAVTSGKWYFEFEVLTAGSMRVGWTCTGSTPGYQLGADADSWAFDGFQVL